jgi:hypothetical protein
MDRLRAQHVTRRGLAPWVLEALALQQLGMPKESFTLVLNREPTHKNSERTFATVVQRDAAWQEAFERHCAEKVSAPLWRKIRSTSSFVARRFPGALRDITAGWSIAKCNFELGGEWDPEPLVQTARN